MRVVARVHAYPPARCAGAELMLAELLDALAARGHDCVVSLSHPCGHPEPYQWGDVTVIPAETGENMWTRLRSADVIVTHIANAAHIVTVGPLIGRPTVLLVHQQHNGFTPPQVLERADQLVFNSHWLAAAHGYHPDRDRRVTVVRPPVDPADYVTTAGDHTTLINCSDAKGGRLLADLADRMPRRRFLAVRGGYDTHIPQRSPNVETVPHTPRMVDDVYSRTRVLLMPSAHESWGRVGVEAMASGIPVIAHRTPGLEESLSWAGVWADRHQPQQWVDALTGLDDPDRYGAASRAVLARSAELDPTADLDRWVTTVEALAERPVAA